MGVLLVHTQIAYVTQTEKICMRADKTAVTRGRASSSPFDLSNIYSMTTSTSVHGVGGG